MHYVSNYCGMEKSKGVPLFEPRLETIGLLSLAQLDCPLNCRIAIYESWKKLWEYLMEFGQDTAQIPRFVWLGTVRNSDFRSENYGRDGLEFSDRLLHLPKRRFCNTYKAVGILLGSLFLPLPFSQTKIDFSFSYEHRIVDCYRISR